VSQHGRRGAKADKPQQDAKSASKRASASSGRRFGPISAESLLVLTLAGIIAGGSVLVNRVDPGTRRTETTVGATTYTTHNLGQGGIKPGDIQARTISQVRPVTSDKVAGDNPPPSPKPIAKKGGKATPAPTAPAAGTIGTGSPTGGGAPTGGGSGSGPAGGGTGGGAPPCTGLGSLLGGCGTKPTATGPQAGATPPAAQ
jgi:hypothetical protein